MFFDKLTLDGRRLMLDAADLNSASTPGYCVSTAHIVAAIAASPESGAILQEAGVNDERVIAVLPELIGERGEPTDQLRQLSSSELVGPIQTSLRHEAPESVGPMDLLRIILDTPDCLGVDLLQRADVDPVALRHLIDR